MAPAVHVRGIMSLTALLLGLSLMSPVAPAQADTGKAEKPKPEAKAPARPAKPEPRIEPKPAPKIKPLPLGEPKLKRRKPD
ncbi:MAG TPA: hypothetical protein VLB00_05455 [Gemmatimonadales bacterium]|nr:hypothetical protein [Gemmatimonadales bacterium]